MNVIKSLEQQRTGIIVLGMHRSGTSLLTRIISSLGAALPLNCLGANESNATGHWEPRSLIWLHEQMLEENGSRWDDWCSFDFTGMPPERQAHFSEEVARLLKEEYGRTPIFVLKEPRMSRFVQLYIGSFEEWGVQPKFVLTSRNPLEVAASLNVRDRITPGYAMLIWLRHELDAERATRYYPRTFVSYECILEDKRLAVERIVKLVEDPAFVLTHRSQNEINEYLSPLHRHHRVAAKDFEGDERVLSWVKEAYAALKALEVNANDRHAISVLDGIKAEFDAFSATFGPVFVLESNIRTQILRERHQREVDAFESTIDALRQEAADLKRKLDENLETSIQIRKRLEVADTSLETLLQSKTYKLSTRIGKLYRWVITK